VAPFSLGSKSLTLTRLDGVLVSHTGGLPKPWVPLHAVRAPLLLLPAGDVIITCVRMLSLEVACS